MMRLTLLLVFGCGLCCGSAFGAERDSQRSSQSPSERAERILKESETRFKNNSTNVTVAWQFARACFDLAELAAKDAERAELAKRGIAVCRQLIERDPKRAAAYYYLALNLGQLARTKSLGALKLLSEMEREAKTALDLDPSFDYAGPDRFLGMLYHEAPGWPASIGSKSKARAHLLKAVERSPDYPENRLNLLEAYWQWGEKNKSQADLSAMEKIMEQAHKTFAGDEWADSWRDWEKRWEKIKRKTAASSVPNAKQRSQ